MIALFNAGRFQAAKNAFAKPTVARNRDLVGGTAAKVSVSALLFDYVLTSSISAVSAALYLAGLINGSARHQLFMPLRDYRSREIPAVPVPASLISTSSRPMPLRSVQ